MSDDESFGNPIVARRALGQNLMAMQYSFNAQGATAGFGLVGAVHDVNDRVDPRLYHQLNRLPPGASALSSLPDDKAEDCTKQPKPKGKKPSSSESRLYAKAQKVNDPHTKVLARVDRPGKSEQPRRSMAQSPTTICSKPSFEVYADARNTASTATIVGGRVYVDGQQSYRLRNESTQELQLPEFSLKAASQPVQSNRHPLPPPPPRPLARKSSSDSVGYEAKGSIDSDDDTAASHPKDSSSYSSSSSMEEATTSKRNNRVQERSKIPVAAATETVFRQIAPERKRKEPQEAKSSNERPSKKKATVHAMNEKREERLVDPVAFQMDPVALQVALQELERASRNVRLALGPITRNKSSSRAPQSVKKGNHEAPTSLTYEYRYPTPPSPKYVPTSPKYEPTSPKHRYEPTSPKYEPTSSCGPSFSYSSDEGRGPTRRTYAPPPPPYHPPPAGAYTRSYPQQPPYRANVACYARHGATGIPYDPYYPHHWYRPMPPTEQIGRNTAAPQAPNARMGGGYPTTGLYDPNHRLH